MAMEIKRCMTVKWDGGKKIRSRVNDTKVLGFNDPSGEWKKKASEPGFGRQLKLEERCEVRIDNARAYSDRGEKGLVPEDNPRYTWYGGRETLEVSLE